MWAGLTMALITMACAPSAPSTVPVDSAHHQAASMSDTDDEAGSEPESSAPTPAPGTPREEPVHPENSRNPQPNPRPTPWTLVDPGPMYERSAEKGDGAFLDFFASASDDSREARIEEGTPPDFGHAWVRRLVLHPHPASPYQTLVLAAFDLTKVALGHRPGAQDVVDVGRKDLVPDAGLVPTSYHDRLVGVFNGGFQPRHGRWGMFTLGQELIAPRDDACTVAILKDGSVAIGPWTELKVRRDEVVAFRQTPPCLVRDGAIHPLLEVPKRGPWAGQQPSRKTRRRSVVGLSRDGRTLFVGLGTETEPETLARGMLHAGAYFAAQLDINWNWTRLFLYDSSRAEGPPREMGALVPQMVKDRGEYITRKAPRGFFFVYQRRAPRASPERAP